MAAFLTEETQEILMQPGATVRYEILGYDEIPVDRIFPNPDNPRPNFHFSDDDPELIALGDSIKSSGQHRPAIVYEMVGGWRPECQDNQGHYMLLQGESRWRACTLAKVDVLRCLIVRTPKDKTSELEWLGVEEAFKREWQPFFVMRFAHRLANELNIEITNQKITARTGLTTKDLKLAEKIFKLEPEIQAILVEYEEILYKQRQNRMTKGRISGGSGIRSKEFTTSKAGHVWDIFQVLREKHAFVVKEYDDLELQRRIASKATKGSATDKEMQALLSALNEPNVNERIPTEIANLLANEEQKIKDTVRTVGHRNAIKHRKLIRSLDALRTPVRAIHDSIDQVGTDLDQLETDKNVILRLINDLQKYEHLLDKKVTLLRAKQQ